ncbi:hypothetical protein O4H29_06785 [Marinobacter salarius]|jgi:hypothetical protein|uniref:hypothetical protein n=1 Tax=Marinobacter salarius TaxID=1420917 RepID=UPI0022B1CDAE|nr:hypothetical protein [Marinobacter salarius]MCZ4284538.1 hypothetical protein [Marinobacter salarius]
MPNTDEAIRPILSHNIPIVWGDIADGIEAVRAKAGIDDPEQIFRRLCRSEAFLFFVPEGFFILLPVYRQVPSVLVWVAYSKGTGLIGKYLPKIESLARDIGAEQLEFTSDRPGYRRAFRDWQRTGQRYIRRLS